MAITAERGVHRNIQGIPVSLTASPHASFNVALVIERPRDMDRFIAEATEFAHSHGVPLGIATREHVTDALRPYLDDLGYELETVEPAFV